MNILVTGGAGYIGSVCAQALLDGGHEVAVFDDLSEGHRSAVPASATFILGSGQPDAFRNAVKSVKPDAILHFAANALVGESMVNPGKYFRNNVARGLGLLEAAVEFGVRKFVFSSSCATYGLPEASPITEATPQQPVNPYGESKLMFERMLRWYERIHGLNFIAFRYFNAAGATEHLGEHHRIETHLIPNVLKVALGQSPCIEIYGDDYPTPDGTCIRDYIHVQDIARAHILGLGANRHGFYNLGNGGGVSVRQVVEACERVVGRSIPCVIRPRRPGDPPKLIASAEKAKHELGWKPEYNRLDDIVASAWQWHRRQPRGYAD